MNYNAKDRKSQAERRHFGLRVETRWRASGCRTANHAGGESRKHPVRWPEPVRLKPFVRYSDISRSIETAAMKTPLGHDDHASRRSQFTPVIKLQTAGGRAPCSFPSRFSRRSREEKRGGNRCKHGRTADCGLLLMEGVNCRSLIF